MFTVIIVGLACSALSGGSTPVPQPQNDTPPIQLPTESSVQPAPPTPEPQQQQPTTAPLDIPQDFFKEEFNTNTNLGNWSYFTMGSGSKDDSNLSVESRDDGLLFDLGTLDLYVYYLYEAQLSYRDTTITLVAENRGVNNNNVSLVCRLNYDKGQWYEYSFESGGVWYLYSVESFSYKRMDNGGSTELRQGLAVNEYAMTCEGNVITIYINGKKLKSYTDNKNFFNEGQVGFNISSLNVLPVTVNVKSFEIAEP
jgi:hypothetical protein